METRRSEWHLVAVGLAVVAVLGAVQLVAWPPTRDTSTLLDKTRRCLEREMGIPTRTTRDPIALSAAGGALGATIEGNDVSISFPRDELEARRIVSAYHQVGGPLEGQLERRLSSIYLWARPATPTQRQTTYDCAYGGELRPAPGTESG